MASAEKILDLIEEARRAGLDGLDFLARFDLATLAREYNGIGPEWAGENARDWATAKFRIFEPAALIHDLRNYESDGTERGFHFANGEFVLNCLKLADRTYGWYDWRRYRARALAQLLFDFVEGPGGWRAWLEAHEKNVKRLKG